MFSFPCKQQKTAASTHRHCFFHISRGLSRVMELSNYTVVGFDLFLSFCCTFLKVMVSCLLLQDHKFAAVPRGIKSISISIGK